MKYRKEAIRGDACSRRRLMGTTPRRIVVAVLSVLAAAATLQIAAAAFPEKPIHYVLHVSPGGATDVLARVLATALEKQLGQTVVVENRPGGSGARQMAALEKGPNDGHVIGAVTASHIAIFQQRLKEYNIDSVEWVAQMVVDPYLFAASPNAKFQSLEELAAYAKANPGKVKIAGFELGSGGHIAWEILSASMGLPRDAIIYVPYRSVKDGIVATLGGHADFSIGYVDLVLPYATTNKLNVIGVMSDKRSDLLPNAPTIKEAGFDADTDWQQFRGIIAPKGTPPDRQQALAEAIRKAMETPEFKKYVKDAQLMPEFRGPGAFRAFVKKQDDLTRDWLQKLKLAK
ncbi:MAG: hypothetical protein GEU95_18465 [Rhizobiales bacterium]|nr:hypothetical protein [Hyphomicrobiales bacterium]